MYCSDAKLEKIHYLIMAHTGSEVPKHLFSLMQLGPPSSILTIYTGYPSNYYIFCFKLLLQQKRYTVYTVYRYIYGFYTVYLGQDV